MEPVVGQRESDERPGRAAGVVAERLTLEHQVLLVSGSSHWCTQPLPEVGLPATTLSDGPHGLRFQSRDGDHLGQGLSEPSTCFPTAVTLASTWDEDLPGEVGAALAVEARAVGVDVVLGPGLNIKRHPRGGRNFEYFSEDPLVAGRMAAAMVRGIQSRASPRASSTSPSTTRSRRRMVVDAIVDERTLRELYLTGFEIAVKASPSPGPSCAATTRSTATHGERAGNLLDARSCATSGASTGW